MHGRVSFGCVLVQGCHEGTALALLLTDSCAEQGQEKGAVYCMPFSVLLSQVIYPLAFRMQPWQQQQKNKSHLKLRGVRHGHSQRSIQQDSA